MNHDYAHCLDYTPDCPKECFRAQLQRDLEERRSEFIGVPLTCSHLGGTVECKLAKGKDVTCKMSLETDCVNRQAAIEVIDAVFPVDPMKSEYARGIACGAALAKTYVEQLPSAQPDGRKESKDESGI